MPRVPSLACCIMKLRSLIGEGNSREGPLPGGVPVFSLVLYSECAAVDSVDRVVPVMNVAD